MDVPQRHRPHRRTHLTLRASRIKGLNDTEPSSAVTLPRRLTAPRIRAVGGPRRGRVMQTRDDPSVNHIFSMAVVRLGLPAQASIATVPGHPVGIPLAFATIVGGFLAILGIMIAVGHLRGRRKPR